MTPLVTLLATNAVLAVPLAILAWAAERGLRRPGVAHALWALALLKLLTPPLLPLPVFPAAAAPGPARAADPADRAGAYPDEGAGAPAIPLASMTLGDAAGAGVAAGGALVLALAFVRGRRFLRLVSHACPAQPGDQARLLAVASRMGVGAPITFELVAARVPPLVWAGARGPRLLLAQELRAQLSPAELEAVLAHELAHLRRRDHWMRAAELAVAALFWWYPLAWWVRRRLRAAEERCCDEWVLRALPGGARDYARALVKSAGFASAALPAGASGAVAARDLELRIRGILMSRPTRVLSRPWRLLLAGVAGIVLAALPTRAQDPNPQETTGTEPAEAASEDERGETDRREAALEEQRRVLEAHRRELEATRAEIEAARAALERERRELIDAHEAERRALEAAAAEAAEEVRKPREAARPKPARKAEAAKEAARAKFVRKAEAQRAAAEAKAARKAARAEAAEAALAANEVQRAVAAAHAQAVREAIRASADAMREGTHAHAQAIREAMKATTEAHARAVREAVRASSEAHAQAVSEAMRNLAVQLSELSRQNRLGPEVIERIKAEIDRMREAVEGTENR